LEADYGIGSSISATGSFGDKQIEQDGLGMDWPYDEETRWTCSQEGTVVEPIGEAKERKTLEHLAMYENGRVGEETSYVE